MLSSSAGSEKWRVRTSFELYITAVNVPKRIEAGHQPRDFLAAALFSLDLNTEISETIGLSSIVESKFPDDNTLIPSSILLPLRFNQRQQLTIRLYASSKDHFASNSTSIQDKLQSTTLSMIGEAVFMLSDLITASGLSQIGPDTMGFVRSLRSGSGSGLVHDLRPMQVALHWRERHYNNRSSKVLAQCTIDPAFRPSGIERITSKPSWRLGATRECVVDVRSPEIKAWSQVLSTGKAMAISDPSWFLDIISVDALIPEDGDPLRLKLWRFDPLRDPRLFGEAFVKRQSILKWIEMIEQEDRGETRKGQDADLGNNIDRLSIIGTAPKLLEVTMRAIEDESITTARLTFEAAKITRSFSLFEYLGGGMRFNLTIAVDVHSANGEPSEAKSLHYDDPRKIEPSPYFRFMKPVLQFLIPFTDKIYPIGFAGQVSNQTNAKEMGFFHLSRTKPSGLVDTFDEFSSAYRDALPALQMGKTRNLAPLLSRAVDEASQAGRQAAAKSYSVVVVFTNGVPDDFLQVSKTIHDAVHVPLSVMIVGIEPGRSSSRLQKTFERLRDPPARIVQGRATDRCNVQFVSTAGASEEQVALRFQAVMNELENQAVTYLKEHRIQPAVVKALAPAPVPVSSEPARLNPIARQLSEFVPALSGVHNALRSLSRKPSLNRQRTREDQIDEDVSEDSNESGVVSGVRSRPLSREPSNSGMESSRLLSPGLSRVPSRSRDHGPEASNTSAKNNQINNTLHKEQTELEIQKDKANAANAIRDKYRSSPQKGILEYKARTNLRDSIQLKLAVDAYEWKKKMSNVSDTLSEASAPMSFRAPHQVARFPAHPKPADGMPKTIFNKNVVTNDSVSGRSRSNSKSSQHSRSS